MEIRVKGFDGNLCNDPRYFDKIGGGELIEYKGDVYVVCKKRTGEASYNSCVDCVRNEGNGKFTVVIAVKMPPNGNKRYVDLPTEKNAAGEFVFTDYPYWDRSE